MTRSFVMLPGTTAVSPVADPARGGGVVLRGVAVHREPHTLRRPAVKMVGGVEPHPQPRGLRQELGVARSDAQGDPTGEGGDANVHAAEQDEASYREGHRVGYTDAEAAQRSTLESALERAQRAGFERGLQEGRERGLVDGRETGRQAVEREARGAQEATVARVEQLDQLLSALPGELSRRLATAEDDMVALCHGVVCRILGEQLLTREAVAQCVRQAIREACSGSSLRASGHGGIAIHVHPRDLESLQGDEQLAAWLRQGGSAGSVAVQWVADEGVRLGGCIVHSSEGSLDGRLETQMAALREILSRAPSADASAMGALPREADAAIRTAGASRVGA